MLKRESQYNIDTGRYQYARAGVCAPAGAMWRAPSMDALTGTTGDTLQGLTSGFDISLHKKARVPIGTRVLNTNCLCTISVSSGVQFQHISNTIRNCLCRVRECTRLILRLVVLTLKNEVHDFALCAPFNSLILYTQCLRRIHSIFFIHSNRKL